MINTRNPVIDYSRKWQVMAALAVGIFLETIDFSSINVALPTLVQAFDTTFATVQWVLLAPLLTQTTLMLSIGRLGDMIGKKPIYITGLGIFLIGTVFCGLAPSVGWLIAFRIIQAIGGAMLIGLIFALVTEAFPPTERGKAVGMITSTVSIGIIIGPMLSGLMIDLFSWRYIFFASVPLAIIGIVLGIRFIPSTNVGSRQPFDFLGAAVFCISLLSLLLALTLGQERGFTQRMILALFAISTIFAILFLFVEWRSAYPMIDLRMFKNGFFSSNLTVRILSFVTYSGLIVLLPFYLQNIQNYTPRQTGYLLTVVPICMALISPFSGMLSDRFGTLRICTIGLITIAVGYVSVSMLTVETSTLSYVLHLIPFGVGMAIFQAPNNSAIMGVVPRNRSGVASGLISITRTLGQTIGIAILGAVWASRVAAYNGKQLDGGVTQAPISAQIMGFNDTFIVAACIIVLGLGIGLWSWRNKAG